MDIGEERQNRDAKQNLIISSFKTFKSIFQNSISSAIRYFENKCVEEDTGSKIKPNWLQCDKSNVQVLSYYWKVGGVYHEEMNDTTITFSVSDYFRVQDSVP